MVGHGGTSPLVLPENHRGRLKNSNETTQAVLNKHLEWFVAVVTLFEMPSSFHYNLPPKCVSPSWLLGRMARRRQGLRLSWHAMSGQAEVC